MTRRAGTELRTLQFSSALVGLLTVVAAISASLVVAQEDGSIRSCWLVVLIGAAIALPLGCGIAAPWVGLRAVRVLNAAIVVEYAALVVVLLALALAGRFEGSELPWFFTVPVIPVAAALFAWGTRAAWLVLVLTSVMLQVIRVAIAGFDTTALSSDLFGCCTAVAFILLGGVLLAASRELDRSGAAAEEAVTRVASAEARASAAIRLQAVVHDELLATLLAAAQTPASQRDAVARQAIRARSMLAELQDVSRTEPVDADRFVMTVRELVGAEFPDTGFVLADERHGPGAAALSADDALALRDAVRQALANSVVHAGAGARRRLSVRLGDDRLAIRVEDDGVGFDPGAVAAGRMGIATSILGRVRALPGGSAEVVSQPGIGAIVTVSVPLRAASEGPSGFAAESPASPPAAAGASAGSPAGVLSRGGDPLRRGLVTAIVAFLFAQAGLAVLAGVRSGDIAVQAGALVGLSAGFAVMGWRGLARPGLLRSCLALLAVVAIAALSYAPVRRDPGYYGDVWYIPAAAFVLLVLAARRRPLLVAAGGTAAAIIGYLSASVDGNDVADVFAAVNRFVAIVLIGVLFVVGIGRIRARSERNRYRELAETRERVAMEATTAELRDRSREFELLVGGTLDVLASGAPLSEADRRECAALEGRLRDHYRGGRLSRPPLVEAAMRARRRGVDVVLQDDAHERSIDDAEAAEIAAWMARRIASATEQFTGRILPPGRGALASAMTDGDLEELVELLPR